MLLPSIAEAETIERWPQPPAEVIWPGFRPVSYASVRIAYTNVMATINADEVRIPRGVREAVARHEQVFVLNRERPVLAIVHPEDLAAAGIRRRGRSVREIATLLAAAPSPDVDFAKDMEGVLSSVGSIPEDPWARS